MNFNNQNLYRSTTVTPSDVTGQRLAGFIVTVAGNVVCTPELPDGSLEALDTTFTGLTVGQMIPIAVGFIKATGTTATIRGLA